MVVLCAYSADSRTLMEVLRIIGVFWCQPLVLKWRCVVSVSGQQNDTSFWVVSEAESCSLDQNDRLFSQSPAIGNLH
jgi:hypothetical protein